jgi:hypothetical protein
MTSDSPLGSVHYTIMTLIDSVVKRILTTEIHCGFLDGDERLTPKAKPGAMMHADVPPSLLEVST